ncbi:LAME_0F19856g1_1 [Lachancea meyersii CBS 8951]|uniref:LAME_0F19856g1_1 n=1 Tax=Lachancea meyersii CBS 8951 TaxID=1266667 RepID=A0A1G4K1Q4_9SACH|nr:LAME_0F19856g1_1 [Lachancea meyersii CBS 8951]
MSNMNDRVELEDVRIDTGFLNEDGAPAGEVLRLLKFYREEVLHLVPTSDLEVQATLERFGAVCVAEGESLRDRRERLADLVFQNPTIRAQLVQDYNNLNPKGEGGPNQMEEDDDEEFYTPASEALIQARRFLVRDSLDRARKRLEAEAERASVQGTQDTILSRRVLNSQLATYELQGSQVVSGRPVSKVAYAPDQKLAATGSWKGDIQILNPDTLQVVRSIENAHENKIGGLDWDSTSRFLVSGGADNLVKLWEPHSDEPSPRAVFKGHENRVANVKFHPSDRYVASASFDMTWRLWDVETQAELQSQEGHSKEVYSLDFQGDGSLICSAGLDSIARIWDMRSGNSIIVLEGHAKPIYGVSWSPNGHVVATASGDGTVKVWDLRSESQPFSILAHNSIVSDVQFEKNHGRFLVSSSYDKTIGVFSADSWLKLATLEGHADKILSVDIAREGLHLLSCGWDRSVKKWSLYN